MSYILDALKKADAERERGAVPGLHSQPLGQIEDELSEGPKPFAPALWIGAGVGLCLIAVLSWQLLMREPVPPAAPTAPTPNEAVTALAAPPPQLQQLQQLQQQQQQQHQQQQPPQPTPANAVPYPPPPAPPSPDRADTPRAPVAKGQAPAKLPVTAKSPTAGERVPSIQELPDEVRRDLPQLVIGGAMYSETPASRMLIINSQVFHEGDQPYQGLALKEIRLKSAVFEFRGYRYAVNY